LRARLAAKAFTHTARYDTAIAEYLTAIQQDGSRSKFPAAFGCVYERVYGLRYGENPHQQAAFYRDPNAPAGSLARAEVVSSGSKELSFNNLVDCDAALDAVREFDRPAAVVVKHTNPCGVATADDLVTAYRTAREADALSAYGGIVALNREVDATTAEVLAETFLECIVAPSFSERALARLSQKKNLRLLATGAWLPADYAALQWKYVGGGLLAQDRDATAGLEVGHAKVATKRSPTDAERASLEFAWRVCKHVKSNAIVLARDLRTVGVGAGQMSRVVSVEIAVKKAGAEAKGSVLASDAYFPFPDGVEAAAAAGVTAIVQPGGSVRDPDVIAAADAANIAMLFTGFRHFRH
jgi:phosphoribosylaminoimidazolecarboxamide formyltransferase/IMP cyclohydrolase